MLVGLGDAVYGPVALPAGNRYRAYTPISNALTGDGSEDAPWQITTSVVIGDSSVRLVSQLTYRSGQNAIEFATTIENGSAARQSLTLFHAGDIYLEFPNNKPDFGYGTRRAATNGIGATTSSGDRAFLFEPIEPTADAYQEALFPSIWDAIGSENERGPGFDNTFRTDYHDAAAGLQWNLNLDAGASQTVRHRLRLEAVDLRPFSPRVDAPNIKNWSIPTAFSWEDFRQTYGSAAIERCDASGNNCIHFPEADVYYNNSFTNQGKEGHCYGMTLMSALFYRGIYAAPSFDAAATTPFDLTLASPGLERQIAIFHTFQNATNIRKQTATARLNNSPNTVLAAIRARLANNNLDPYLLLIHGRVLATTRWNGIDLPVIANAAHVVLPYAIEDGPLGITYVSVYDPNDPGNTGRKLEFDTVRNTWAYTIQHWGFAGTWFWGGDATEHGIGVIPISAHTGQQPQSPFERQQDAIQVEGSYGAFARLLATDAQGRRVGTDGATIYAGVPGAFTNPTYGDAVQGLDLTLPRGSYAISVTSAVTVPVSTDVRWYGAGFSASVENAALQPTTNDELRLNGNDDGLIYFSNDQWKPVGYTLAYSRLDDMLHTRYVQFDQLTVSEDSLLNIESNRATDTFTLRSTGSVTSTYSLRIQARDGE